MAHNQEETPTGDAALDDAPDDTQLVAWLLALLEETPDVYARVPPGGANAATTLREGLGIDSIGRLCVFYAVADALGAPDDESVVATWTTVGDVLAFARARWVNRP